MVELALVSRGQHVEKTGTRGIRWLSVALNRAGEKERDRKLVGGRETERHVVPFMVAILLRFEHVGWRSTRRRWRSKGASGAEGRGVKGTTVGEGETKSQCSYHRGWYSPPLPTALLSLEFDGVGGGARVAIPSRTLVHGYNPRL